MKESKLQNSSPQSGTTNGSSPEGRASKQGTSWFRKSIFRFAVILIATFFMMTKADAQVNIPDNAFFDYLVNTLGFIELGPNQIYDIQAEFYDSPLNIDSLGIADLTGIQAFTSLTYLNCNGNSLTSLDVSQNTALKYLDCGSNSLTSLDVSHNTALQNLRCQNNAITSLDVSNNTALTGFNSVHNNLSSLNLANGNNGNMVVNNSGSFGTYNNPNLACITVDNAAYSNIYWTHWIDTWTSFSLNCSITCSETVNIPDPAFLAFCLANYDTNHDGVIEVCEAQAVRGDMPLSQLGIMDLTGIQAFINIKYLECDHNSLSSLDVSSNTALTNLNCSNNSLTSINISNLTGLTYLLCNENSLSSLDISAFSALYEFDCSNNNISSLDVSSNTALTGFKCSSNSLTSLNINNVTGLTYLLCNNNPLGSLDVSHFPALNYLIASYNNLTSLDVSHNPALQILYCNNNNLPSIDVSQNAELNTLVCSSNPFSSLDISHNAALTYLFCPNNNLTTLDFSHNPVIDYITCSYNNLTTLDFSNNPALADLYADDNSLTSINLSNCTLLGSFWCFNNSLSTLDVSQNPNLGGLLCYNNNLSSLDVSHNPNIAYLDFSSNHVARFNMSNYSRFYNLICNNNALKYLDLSHDTAALYSLICNNNNLIGLNIANGQNTSLDTISTIGNPNLSCIQVDNVSYSTTNWSSFVDNTASFNTSCPCSNIVNIPDAIFKAYLLAYFDSNNDGEIEVCEAEAVNEMEPTFSLISDLTGIEAFTNLTYLECQYNHLSSIDLSHNILLEFLSCTGNTISSLDVSQNIHLQTLRCNDNSLSSLDLSNNTMLIELNCGNNSINSLDVNNNTALIFFQCYGNNISSLDISHNPELTYVECSNNNLTNLNVANGNNTNFTTFNATNNSNLQCIQVDNVAYSDANWSNGINGTEYFSTNCACIATVNIPDPIFKAYLLGRLDINTNGDGEIQVCEATAFTGTIDVSSLGVSDLTGIEAFTNLKGLVCHDNNISSLNVSSNTALTSLYCSYNPLNTLDVSNNTALTDLYCWNCNLTTLDVSHNLALSNLVCYANAFGSIDISNNTALSVIDCHGCSLNSLDVSNNPALIKLYCFGNSLNSLDVSNNPAIQQLLCSDNSINSLDVTHNPVLSDLECQTNNLTSLDVSTNLGLDSLLCGRNFLTILDVSLNHTLKYLDCSLNNLNILNAANVNNTNFTGFIATNNTSLTCIQVDNTAYSNANWSADIDNNASFNTNCTCIWTPPVPPVITFNTATSFCQGGSVNLDAGVYTSYNWNTIANTEAITASTNGNYSVTVTSADGCTGMASQAVVVNANPSPSIAANGNTTFCQGGSVMLNAGLYSSYLWNTNAVTPSITVSSGGNYSVTVTDGNGCTGMTSQAITVNANPTPTITANGATTFCLGGSVILNAGSYSSYHWSTTAITQSITESSSGNYSVTVTNANGCTGSISQTVTVNPNPIVAITGPTSICNGGQITLTSSALTSYIWSTGALTPSINVNTPGTYKVTATNTNGCTGSASQIVVSTTLTNPVITGPTTTCSGNSVTLGLTNNYTTYLWNTNAVTPTISVNATGLYSVTVTMGNCTGSTHLSVTVFPNPAAVIIGTGLTTYCEGGDAVLSVAAFQSYHWSTGANTQSITVLPNNPGTYLVTVTNTGGCSAVGNYTLNAACVLPAGLTTASIAATSAYISWVPPSCVYGYTIRISKHNANAWTNYTIPPNSHYTFSGLVINTPYDWQIQSNCNASGSINSGFSPSQTFTTLLREAGDGITNPDQQFNVYPNPANDHAIIAFTAGTEDTYSIRLMDVTGRIIQATNYTSVIGENQYQLNLSSVAKGVYTVILQNGTTLLQSKIVVQ